MWFMEVHADCFRRREFEAISVGPDRERDRDNVECLSMMLIYLDR